MCLQMNWPVWSGHGKKWSSREPLHYILHLEKTTQIELQKESYRSCTEPLLHVKFSQCIPFPQSSWPNSTLSWETSRWFFENLCGCALKHWTQLYLCTVTSSWTWSLTLANACQLRHANRGQQSQSNVAPCPALMTSHNKSLALKAGNSILWRAWVSKNIYLQWRKGPSVGWHQWSADHITPLMISLRLLSYQSPSSAALVICFQNSPDTVAALATECHESHLLYRGLLQSMSGKI